MSLWFRVYDDAMNDPKIQRLAPHLFKAWFNILCLANKSGNGVLPAISDIAFALRMSDTDTQAVVDELILAGLLDIAPDKGLSPHNWKARQAPSDKSKERTRKWRSGEKKSTADGGDGSVTVGDRHSDGDVTARDGHGDGLDKHREEKDIDLVSSTSPRTPRAKGKKPGFDIFGLKGKDEKGVNTITKRAEGLGLDVTRLLADVDARKPDNPSAYFTKLCVSALREKLPQSIPEQMIRDALWSKNAEAYTAIIAALMLAEDVR